MGMVYSLFVTKIILFISTLVCLVAKRSALYWPGKRKQNPNKNRRLLVNTLRKRNEYEPRHNYNLSRLKILLGKSIQHCCNDDDYYKNLPTGEPSTQSLNLFLHRDFTIEYDLELDGIEKNENNVLENPLMKWKLESIIKDMLNAKERKGNDKDVEFHNFVVFDYDNGIRKKTRGKGKGMCKGNRCRVPSTVAYPKTTWNSETLDNDLFQDLRNYPFEIPWLQYELVPNIKENFVQYLARFSPTEEFPWLSLSSVTLTAGTFENDGPWNDYCLTDAKTCESQRIAILSVFNALSSNVDEDPETDTHECSWPGVACDDLRRITQLRIENRNSSERVFPEECADLIHLRRLFLRNNGIIGTIPTTLGRLTNIEVMSLESNRLTGEIPSEFGFFAGITELRLSQNNFIGGIPSHLGTAVRLEILDVSRNRNLGSSIPTEFGNLDKLKTLILHDCAINNALPNSLSRLTELEEVLLGDNALSGNIDVFAKATKLRVLDLADNKFTGSIPNEFEHLRGLNVLNLYRNDLTGRFPIFVDNFPSLTEFILAKNNIRGYISSEIGTLTNLKIFDVADNDLTLSLPTQVGQLHKLKTLNLHGNNFEGSLPSEIGALTELYELVLSGNKFIGSIPNEFSQLSKLTFLDVGNNALTGSVPTTMNKLMVLDNLYIWNNALTGNVGFFCDIEIFRYDVGEFTKDCDTTQKTVVAQFYVSLKQQYAQIDPECNWEGITCRNGAVIGINLANKQLEGSLSSVVGHIFELEVLDLRNNNLKGTIPEQLAELPFLKYIDLSENDFTGDAPFLCDVSIQVVVDVGEVYTCTSAQPSISLLPSQNPSPGATLFPQLFPSQPPSSSKSSSPSLSPSQPPSRSKSLSPSTSDLDESSAPSITAAPTTEIPAWSQVGPDIDGEAASDQLGTSVAVSDQGHRVFVGGVGVFYAYEDDSVGSGNAENSGWASMRKVDLSAFVQSTITGLSCSSDGTIVFAGEPDHDGERGRLTVVELRPQKKEEEKGGDGGAWRERGAPLLGKNEKDKFAYSVSATDDGDVIVAGAVGGDYVRVFEWSSDLRQWTLSHELDNSDDSNYGFSVSVSSGDGGTLVVGAPKASPNKLLLSGSCFMYSLSPSLLIDVFNGAWMGELFGIHVSSSSDGSRVAVGAAVGWPVDRHSVKLFVRRSSSGGGGSVSYSYDETAHIVEYDGLFGWSVSLSADGRRLAVGAYWNSDAKSLSGKAFVFRVHDDDVKLIGEFEGEDANDYFGYDLAISGNGKRLVVGATRNDGGGSNSGHVRVFKQS